jgi:hypothetical protein
LMRICTNVLPEGQEGRSSTDSQGKESNHDPRRRRCIGLVPEASTRAGGGSYQTSINRALREHIARFDQPLEEILRHVVREEIRRCGVARRSAPSKGSGR